MGGLALAGLVMVLYFHHWRLGATALFLVFAWWAILVTGYYLWTAGLFVASDEGDDHEGFDLFRTRAQDLELEKGSLLKAIKEVEFDHLMGKMSDRDASELSALYRRRAVEILKLLDVEVEGDETGDRVLAIADRIERDIRARLEISGAAEKGRERAERERRARQPRKPVVVAAPATTEAVEEEE
jgi:hypothetical protein